MAQVFENFRKIHNFYAEHVTLLLPTKFSHLVGVLAPFGTNFTGWYTEAS